MGGYFGSKKFLQLWAKKKSKIDHPYLYQLKLHSIANYYLNNGVQEQVKVMINHTSGQIMKYHKYRQPRFPWNTMDFPYIWPDTCEFLTFLLHPPDFFVIKFTLKSLDPPTSRRVGKAAPTPVRVSSIEMFPFQCGEGEHSWIRDTKKTEVLLQVSPLAHKNQKPS